MPMYLRWECTVSCNKLLNVLLLVKLLENIGTNGELVNTILINLMITSDSRTKSRDR